MEHDWTTGHGFEYWRSKRNWLNAQGFHELGFHLFGRVDLSTGNVYLSNLQFESLKWNCRDVWMCGPFYSITTYHRGPCWNQWNKRQNILSRPFLICKHSIYYIVNRLFQSFPCSTTKHLDININIKSKYMYIFLLILFYIWFRIYHFFVCV